MSDERPDPGGPDGGDALDPTTLTERSAEGPSRQIGPYLLLDLLGEGGMGEVWRAEQRRPVRRIVALKIIKRGMDSKHVIARFEAERQALALMDHPAVSTVFDAGITPRGRPYFAMEHVRGVPITSYCDRNRLDVHARLSLFCDVCAGVQHAHHKAIIHRDLKPSNILVASVDGRPVPKIIDFGVAKATAQRLTEATLHTQLGTFVGTPEYMSPEQADLTCEDVDTRTDVYALGVILYDLLVGALPFDRGALSRLGLPAFVQMIREDEPSRPSAKLTTLEGEASSESAHLRRVDVAGLKRSLRGDLDWITMKALEKDRNRRYGSPEALAADIRRHLEDQPVEATPPSIAYRSGKFVRRNRTGVVIASLLIVALAGVAVTTTVQARRIARERDRANLEARTAERVADFMISVFDLSGPEASRGEEITARELLERAVENIDAELGDEPALRARMLTKIGIIHNDLGLYESGERLLRQAVEIRHELLGETDDDTLSSLDALATAISAQGRLQEGLQIQERVVALSREHLGPEAPDTLTSMNNLAMDYYNAGRYADASSMMEAVVEARRGAGEAESVRGLTNMNNLALLYIDTDAPDAAERLLREASETANRSLGSDHPLAISLAAHLGQALREQGKIEAARPYYERAVELHGAVNGPEHPDTFNAKGNLAILLADLDEYPESTALLREVVKASSRTLGAGHPDTLNSMNNLGAILREQGLDDEGERLYREVYESQRRAIGEDHPDTLVTAGNLASALSDRGETEAAVELMRQVVSGRDRVLGPEHSRTLDAVEDLALLLDRVDHGQDEAATLRERLRSTEERSRSSRAD